MNYGLNQKWPVDVDAIEIDVRSRVIISLEAGNGYSWLES